MKLHVQGYEKYALLGDRQTLKDTGFGVCEMTLKSLYKSQPLLAKVYHDLVNSGFGFSGKVGELRHSVSTEVPQVDGLFIREEQ